MISNSPSVLVEAEQNGTSVDLLEGSEAEVTKKLKQKYGLYAVKTGVAALQLGFDARTVLRRIKDKRMPGYELGGLTKAFVWYIALERWKKGQTLIELDEYITKNPWAQITVDTAKGEAEFSTQNIADILQISSETVNNWCNAYEKEEIENGNTWKLPCYRSGGPKGKEHIKVKPDDFYRFLTEHGLYFLLNDAKGCPPGRLFLLGSGAEAKALRAGLALPKEGEMSLLQMNTITQLLQYLDEYRCLCLTVSEQGLVVSGAALCEIVERAKQEKNKPEHVVYAASNEFGFDGIGTAGVELTHGTAQDVSRIVKTITKLLKNLLVPGNSTSVSHLSSLR